MHHVVEEVVLEYTQHDLAEWKAGNREQWLKGSVPSHVRNQPSHHFGEYFALTHYQGRGWNGYRFYALGTWEPTSLKLQEGRDALIRCFGQEKINSFQKLRISCGRQDGKGEPDLFLFHPDGRTLFLEVKKERDKVSVEQFECLAQIRSTLKAEIGIVYLAIAGSHYKPKRYEFDLFAHVGRRADAQCSSELPSAAAEH